ncbi:hypothetical protein B0T18DRAFT_44640 [Schizothecium vesticola]|uniref:Uncharacterized protein n=1 Tax=Schizothecium vesticola TaxID=314040 RepID=A0AA40FBJ7_9PEZI|nr:hypothetical protein B0T18DRAFT_44640 [Schizothecium vesticola]
MQQSATLSNESASQPLIAVSTSPARGKGHGTRFGAIQTSSNQSGKPPCWETYGIRIQAEASSNPTSNLLLTVPAPSKRSGPRHILPRQLLDSLATFLAAARPLYALVSFGGVFEAIDLAPLLHDECRRWECRVLGLAILFPHFPTTNRSCKRVDRRGSSLHHDRESKSSLLRRVWHAAHHHTAACIPVICQFPHFPVKRPESQ